MDLYLSQILMEGQNEVKQEEAALCIPWGWVSGKGRGHKGKLMKKPTEDFSELTEFISL